MATKQCTPLLCAGGVPATTGLQNSSAIWGTEGSTAEELDEEKVKLALKRLQDAEDRLPEDMTSHRGRTGYHGLGADRTAVTPEDMEAYNRYRTRAADPVSDMSKPKSGKRIMDGYEMV
jgi:hypothetical protein